MSPVWFPWQRAIRTALATIVAAIVATAGLIIGAALVAPQVLDAVQDLLAPDDYAVLAGWVATLISVAAILSRIMAIPAVDRWLHKFGAGSSPAGAVMHTDFDGSEVGLTRRQYRAMLDGADTYDLHAVDGADLDPGTHA